jgi:hypothetical protein
MFVLSCTKESVSPDLDAGNDVLKKADAAKKVTKTLKFHESTGTMEFLTSELCGDYPLMLVQGTGHATHLGAFTVKNTTCYGSGDVLHGVLTAANGDSLVTIGWPVLDNGVPVLIDGWPSYYYLIENGSGRFEGATGYIDMWGRISDGTFDLVGLGEITY